MNADLKKPLKRFRAAYAKGVDGAIDREGGDKGAGLIRGMAVVTRGEALGHMMWLDSDFLQQTADALNAAKKGLKARFTHPGLSSDGMGKFLGRVKNARVDGDVVRGDLHFSKMAHSTPNGNLAEYVMGLAEEDPKAFATSIVFDSDIGAELAFQGENSGEDGEFVSPDKDNEKNYRHARLAKLWADDIVDEPAANPGGIFHRGQEIPQDAERLLDYALGLSAERPELVTLDADPDRVAGFVQRYMARHGLKLCKEAQMADDKAPEQQTGNDAPPVEVEIVTEDNAMARLSALKAAFPKDPAFVLEQFEAGRDVEQAQTEWDRRELAALRKEVASLKSGRGAQPVAFGSSENSEGGSGDDFITRARTLAADRKIPLHKAMSELSKSEPELHEQYVENARNNGPRSKVNK